MARYFNLRIFLLVIFPVIFSLSCGPQQPKELVYLTLKELQYYDGTDGKPTYVAVDGNVYDISRCRYWKNGDHSESKGKAFAGQDLTDALRYSMHGIKRVKRYPMIGHLVTSHDQPTPDNLKAISRKDE